MGGIKELLNFEIIHLGDYSLTVSKIVYLLGLGVSCWLALFLFSRILPKYKKFDEGQRYTFYTIAKYFLYVFFISAALKLLNIDVTVLVAGSAALFVGIGLGLQALFYDFISGIILLAEGTIKVGNVIQIGEKRVEILAIRFRTSVVKTREEKEIIVPNSFLTKNEIINWSNQRNITRHYISVQVNDKDVDKAMQIMKQVAMQHSKIVKQPEPYVRIEEFSSYSISLKLLFWSEEIFAVGRMLGDIRLQVLKSFRENDIVIPVPHQVITLNKLE